ncbi:rhamnosyltransferase WsaF family glycosyltransferase [Halomonas ramblicola]|uniref:rhamnosyltransferase WsaF family glycosyltransferase n=1 Tax=Halomonas ramblicola TaxID=747349 RepID=UPI0025B2F595|nr:glycosyltransferase [Halomonas ramblicola]MDN3522088.1 glycosyltransferase [Halomonas ramblicola]
MKKGFEESGLAEVADATYSDVKNNADCLKEGAKHEICNDLITWFLPPVTHALKGGVRTVFMLAQHFSEEWGTLNNIVVYSHFGKPFNSQELSDSLQYFFPNLRFFITVFVRGRDDIDKIPPSNVSFCTLWTTAYLQLKYNKTSRKFYLMQDYEPNFYAAGNLFGLIEQTYRFGFSCIANTSGVGNKYKQYSSDVVMFSPGVDQKQFKFDEEKSRIGRPVRIVFYGRPSNPRNCFYLGLETLKAVKRKLKDNVQIISVGEEWDEERYGVEGIVENWGLLKTMGEVAALYRSSDLGLVYMMTPHPSYQPLEYMASGCVTVTNHNENNQWLLNEENALLIEPNPEIAAQKIHDLVRDNERWMSLREQGRITVSKFSWDSVFEIVKKRLTLR